jgi:peptide-methionine (R)-S-oxide reductase
MTKKRLHLPFSLETSSMTRRELIGMGGVGVAAVALAGYYGLTRTTTGAPPAPGPSGRYPVSHSDAEWRAKLSPAAYAILREAGTEARFTSPLLGEHRPGKFTCLGCDQPVFDASTKYDSGTGWPSFWAPIDGAVATGADGSLGMSRTEVHCSRCGGHLGHVFDDGPQPTGLRYCMNGAAMGFAPAKA